MTFKWGRNLFAIPNLYNEKSAYDVSRRTNENLMPIDDPQEGAVYDWLVEMNIEYKLYSRYGSPILMCIEIENKEDAALFKLTWC